MNLYETLDESLEPERYELREPLQDGFDPDRRQFIGALGAGLLFSLTADVSRAQRSAGRAGRRRTIASRLHIGTDGSITVMTGKVEVGQGSRTSLAQAAAEELRVPVDRITLVMADSQKVPNDGGTFGSQTTPRTSPLVRRAAAAAREALIDLAAKRLKTDRAALVARDGSVTDPSSNRSLTYGELAGSDELAESLQREVDSDVSIRPVSDWQILGTSVPKSGAAAIVTGAHRYPSDIVRPGMFFGRVLRPASFGATLKSIDLSAARDMESVVVVHDGDFIGCAAESSEAAQAAIDAVAKTTVWNETPHPSSSELFDYLKANASVGGSGRGRPRSRTTGSVRDGLKSSTAVLNQQYNIAYIAHAPMEPRAAVAEWTEGSVTVWTGTQVPPRVQSELARAFDIASDRVRVIVPDTGGGFGGKHTGEVAVEAARLARAAKQPVKVVWSREEEFTWAYFRPAGVIEVTAGLDSDGNILAWDFANYNSGSSSIIAPYKIPNTWTRFFFCDSPLREGSYRALAATANTFARESAIDELAAMAASDPLEFRLRHLENDRLRAVLQSAAKRFGWARRQGKSQPDHGIGLACGTEKGSYVAACVEVAVDRRRGRIRVVEVCQAFECGAIHNPANLRAQVEGCLIMGLGGALSEEIEFENGKVTNARFSRYRVPRFEDVPEIETVLVNRADLPSVGAGETPIIAIAPAIAGALFAATGTRVRSMPMRLEPTEDV